MKKLLFSLSLLASLASFADGVECSAQVTGVLPITTSAQSVIVCVPWVASGYDGANISVSNIIKTANLTVGDQVKIWNASKNAFDAWTLTAGSDDTKYWKGITVVTASGLTETDGSDITTVARGGAIILTRASKPSASYTFYVIGQYTSASVDNVTVALGTIDTPAYTLIAPPIVSSGTYSLNDDLTWTDYPSGAARTNDYIQAVITTGVTAQYRLSQISATSETWGKMGISGGWVAAKDIQSGTGFWYVSYGGQPTVSFSK